MTRPARTFASASLAAGRRLARAAAFLVMLAASPSQANSLPDLSHAWPDGIPSGPELERAGAVIGKVTVNVGDIFDPSVPGERGWLYTTANKLHVNTRPSIVRDQLLFETGQPYVNRLVQETERVLRSNEYLYDAVIRPTAWDGHTVDLEVRTRDNWTLNPGVNFSRQGGANTGSIEFEERNLLGSGQKLSLGYRSEVDRTSYNFDFYDPHFFSTWTSLGLTYDDADDGATKAVRLDRPFYSLDARHAGGLYLFDTQRNDTRYADGHEVGKFQRDQQVFETFGGWSKGWRDGWVKRITVGATYDRSEFSALPDESLGGPLPADQTFAYPWIGFDLVKDDYEERLDQDQIARTEDVSLGLRAGGRLGLASQALGSTADAVMMNAYVQEGLDLAPGSSLFLGTRGSGRLEDGELRNAVLSAEARYYARTSEKTKFFAAVSGTVSENLDEDQQLLLGGDTGLRGYPLRYQAGTSLALLTLEERYYTDWYPFRLFHVAGAVFYDMGRTWGTDVTGATSAGLLKDVGVGLRLGSSRSAFGNVVHIDLAFPLDGGSDIDQLQFVVETKARF